MSDLTDIVHDFLVESHENLDQLDRNLVALEQDPNSRDTLASIFRTIHTIKGTCGFLGFGKLESVAHAGENLLSKMRDGEIVLSSDITSGLLTMVDAVREMLANIETSGADGEQDYAELIGKLIRLQEEALSGETSQPKPEITQPSTEAVKAIVPEKAVSAPAAVSPQENETTQPPTADSEGSAATVSKQEESQSPSGSNESRNGGAADSSIRVDVSMLDRLMNRVGELVLARNQILQFANIQKDPAFVSTSQRLNLITTELQEGVMKTRMQPIGNIWNKFPRVVRDLALQCGKQARIEMEGKETELDKTIIEAIKDPLTHLVRNAVDHGMELPEARVAAGKSPEGCLTLRAFHEGGQVNIEISDDGRGLDAERIKQKALDRGLITREQAGRMSERELGQLIFLPGFSTAEKVTNVSGRGVGMDVVKTNIEKIGGTVDIQSQLGHGTCIKIKIPLTLAIIPALIVTSGGDRYAIPQVNLLELVRLEGEQLKRGVEQIHGAPVYRLRGQLLPLVYLNHELEIDADGTAGRQLPAGDGQEIACGQPSTSSDSDIANIVVLRADDRQFGLVVDRVNDTEEIVVKPLSKQLKGIDAYAGSTIMGDGRVALILDVLGLAQRANVVSEVRDRSIRDSQQKHQDRSADMQTLLILGLGGDRRAALPISDVARLEEIATSSIEFTDGREVVQYRGEILPLVRLGNVLEVSSNQTVAAETEADELLQVIVYTRQGRSIGLVVDEIVDIAETALEFTRSTNSVGLMGSAIIQQHVTDLLDLPAIIRRVDPSFFSAELSVAT